MTLTLPRRARETFVPLPHVPQPAARRLEPPAPPLVETMVNGRRVVLLELEPPPGMRMRLRGRTP